MTEPRVLGGSYRDPSGFVYVREGVLYRQVNDSYRENYDLFIGSGLYEALTREELLIHHREADLSLALDHRAYKVICPTPVPFVSYPYEWSFDQLRDAALLTLRTQCTALRFGMSLKDASAYNVQYVGCRPVLIDTLSFERYREGSPWVAYRQFCQHFLAPLALMAYCDVRLGGLLRIFVDGVPLDLASQLLPLGSWLRIALVLHVHLHAAVQRRYNKADVESRRIIGRRTVGRAGLLGLIDSLASGVRRLSWSPNSTAWSAYYDSNNYSAVAMEVKEKLVVGFLDEVSPQRICDLGANTGHFSRLVAARSALVVAADADPGAVVRAYRQGKVERDANLLPIVLDLVNPSADLGWAHEERMSFEARGPFDLVLALALVHHLAIANNVPLERVAEYLARLAPYAIVEFVPKEDSQVQRMLAQRDDIFPNYSETGFEVAFGHRYEIVTRAPIADSCRSVYLLRRRS